jgi:hypothetical protein
VTASAAQAVAFYTEALAHGQVWGVRDANGFPAPLNGEGVRAMPFWSTKSRAERVVAKVPAFAGFEPVEVPLDQWRADWLTRLERDGFLVGLNWAGDRAQGYDVAPADVLRNLAARETASE